MVFNLIKMNVEGRKKPFTEFERSLIINLIQKNSAIIENKKVDGVTSQKKIAAWERIAEEYNNSTKISGKVDVKQLKKFWNNLKCKVRESQKKITGVGLAVPDMDSENSQCIFKALTNVQPVIKIGEGDVIPDQQDDDDSHYWSGHIKSKEEYEDMNYEETPMTTEEQNAMIAETTSGSILNSQPECSNKRCRRLQNIYHSTIVNAKRKLLEQDFNNRALKFEVEMQHLKNLQDIELKLKEKELEHKTRMFDLYEEEMKVKIEKLRNN